MEIIKTLTKGNETFNIYQDVDVDSPRNWDNLGIIKSWHRRYNFNDKDAPKVEPEDFKQYAKENKLICIMPLYMLDHSGISLSLKPFNDRWDSGQLGFIFTTKEKVKEFLGKEKITKKVLKQIEEILKNEIETLNQYVEGDVYGFQIIKKTFCECCKEYKEENMASCWGFYGMESIISEAKSYGFIEESKE